MRALFYRRIAFGNILRNNLWVTAFFLYCLLAILWADFPFIAFKRYIKILGHPIMAMIILTDPDPDKALRIVMKRCAYILILLSVLFIKYYPQYGRDFDGWSGEAINIGAMLTKSELGAVSMLFGLFFFWNLMTAWHLEDRRIRREEILISSGFLVMIGWLLFMAHSSTSLVTFFIGVGTMSLLGMNIVNRRFIGTYVIAAIVLVAGAEGAFSVYETVLELLGEDATLTDRTEVWADCIALVSNPIIGEGFENFWLGERLDILWEKWWWRPNQAHNGYIETYLNLGLIGLFLLIGLIISTFRKISNDLLVNFSFAYLRLGFLFSIIFYNFTEATFKGVSIVWTIFHIIAIDNPRQPQPHTQVQKKRVIPQQRHRYKKS
ncbi:MAG: O-antigen ligase family protein [Thiotrichaceae bacterium]